MITKQNEDNNFGFSCRIIKLRKKKNKEKTQNELKNGTKVVINKKRFIAFTYCTENENIQAVEI